MTDTVIGDYKTWAGKLARELLGSNLRSEWAMDWEDLAQIGLIAMWEAELSFDPSKGALPAWLTMRARGAMKNAIRQREKHDRYKYAAPDTALELLESEDSRALDLVLEAYHSGEILEAIRHLTPKQQEYVKARFWGGMSTKELTALFKYDPSALWNSKRNGAKYKLAEALQHLAETG